MAIPLLVSGIAFSAVMQRAEAQQADDVRLRTTRFWRGEGRTLLEGVVGMPFPGATRTVELAVRDSTGKVLHTESVTDSASSQSAALAAMNAEKATQFEMLLRPGLYHVVVRRTEGGRTDSASASVRGFETAPVLSDVVASARMRVLGENEEPTSAEMQRGRYAIERGARVTLLPTEPRLWYYLELYRQGADSVAELEFRVVPAGTDTALVRVTRSIAVGARGTVDAAALVVQGLPPGDYKLHVTARSGGREDRRESSFTMGSFDTAPVAPAPVAASSETTLFDRYFAATVRSDAEINALMEALTVSGPGELVNTDNLQLTTDAKRRFLARYWSRLPDPLPGTPAHELLEEYVQRVTFANRQYGEGGRSARLGIRTDRGRIYLKYGQPDASQSLSIASNNKTVDIWKYTRGRNLKFVFLDETGFRNYNLVFSTDPQERTMHDWELRVGDRETVIAIARF